MKFTSKEHKMQFIEKVQLNKGKLPAIEEILELIKKGLTKTEISIQFGVSRQSVWNAINKYEKSNG